jgi:hypothetical protein
VVAQSIQDMSAVSITDKTVGIRLPHLWCGAIGLAVSACGSPKTGVFFILPFVQWDGDGAVRAEFSTPGENGAKAAANSCQMLNVF